MSRLPDLVRFIGLLPVQRAPVVGRVDGDRTDAQLVGSPERPDGDLPAVRNENLLQHQDHLSGRILLCDQPLLRPFRALSQEGAGDDLAVYLAGPLPYLVDLDLPPVARDRAGLHKALPAPDLDRLVSGPLGRL